MSTGQAAARGASFTAAPGPTGRPSRAHVRTSTHHDDNPLETLGGHIPLPVPVPDWSKPIIIVLLLLAIWFGTRSRLALHRARRLENQRATLLQDLGVMQRTLVPEVPAQLGGLAVSVAYRPADGPAAGGDFYDLFTPAPGKVAVILGDVSGHGREALTHAALTRYTLRAYMQAGLEPRAALALAGQVLCDPAVEHYATVAVGIYDTSRNELTYALAGHPPPILRGAHAEEPITICSSPPIGWGAPTGRRQSTISLPPGAEVCFFSDGLIEARTKDGLLGRARLNEILDELGQRPPAGDLLTHVRAAAEQTPDDMAACIIASDATGEVQHTHVEELEVDAGTLAGDSVERFLDACQVPTRGIAQTLEMATSIAGAQRTALIRIVLQPGETTATVLAPAQPKSVELPQGAAIEGLPSGRPLFQTGF